MGALKLGSSSLNREVVALFRGTLGPGGTDLGTAELHPFLRTCPPGGRAARCLHFAVP
jgi:hypothetical protein